MKLKKLVMALAIGCLMASMLTGCNIDKPDDAALDKLTATETVTQDEETVSVDFTVTADKGWDSDSTPAIAHITDGEDVDFYHAINPNKEGKTGKSTVDLAEGEYTIEVVSPLNKDGSAYEIFDTGDAQTLTVKKDETPSVDIPMTQIPADKVTDEMIKDIITQTEEAVKKGDDTLKGDSGKEVLEKLETNVNANPNVSEETKTETEEVAKTEVQPAETQKQEQTSGNSGNGNSGSSNSSKPSTDNSASGNSDNSENSNSNNSGGNNSSGNGSSSSKPNNGGSSGNSGGNSQPAHKHSYTGSVTKNATCNSAGVKTYTCSCGDSYTESIPATGNHNWEAQYKDTYHAAVTESHVVCKGCKTDFGSGPNADDAAIEHVATSGCYGPYHVTTVTIQDAYTSHDLVGYKCSTCGATK